MNKYIHLINCSFFCIFILFSSTYLYGVSRVLIDPGHGALNKEGKFDGGAFGPDGTKESWINLEV
ncbi:MAG: hypothetical protein WC955_05830 [Elusimicrobiota bacterium]